MKIILFINPTHLGSVSMPNFSNMIANGMSSRGHSVKIFTSVPFFYRLYFPRKLKKWLGYLDQYIVFPLIMLFYINRASSDTIFVFTDQALGMWVPFASKRKHVIHVHDLLALRSSLGEFSQNKLRWTGKKYQQLIKWGFNKGNNFISVSKRTEFDLRRFLSTEPNISKVVYNGLHYGFRPMSFIDNKNTLLEIDLKIPKDGFILHVGGNQWYKNRIGVLQIYMQYVLLTKNPLPIWLVGPPPNDNLRDIVNKIPKSGCIKFINGASDRHLRAIYSTANLMLFPSLAEGFGWPIIEAMACGCIVLTSNDAPMTEVGGPAAFYMPLFKVGAIQDWASVVANSLIQILSLPEDLLRERVSLGFDQAEKFLSEKTLNSYEEIYTEILSQ